jgi:hypothetical protein
VITLCLPPPPYNFLNFIVHEHTEMKFIINFTALIISEAVFFFFFFLQNLLFGPYLFTTLSKVSFHCQFSQINPCIFYFKQSSTFYQNWKFISINGAVVFKLTFFFSIHINFITHPSHWVVSFFFQFGKLYFIGWNWKYKNLVDLSDKKRALWISKSIRCK